MNAYHDEAVMSMHMAYPEGVHAQGAEKLNEYMVRIIEFDTKIRKKIIGISFTIDMQISVISIF